ncbi:hypothetical protein IWX46DRAFT_200529 [Phyllosticta citricarpa]|uniref:Transmembrane protein n=1 Tax=Phyllosticta citricarpa TaxID=55181 RepID=A0ABR1M020_9PEZI
MMRRRIHCLHGQTRPDSQTARQPDRTLIDAAVDQLTTYLPTYLLPMQHELKTFAQAALATFFFFFFFFFFLAHLSLSLSLPLSLSFSLSRKLPPLPVCLSVRSSRSAQLVQIARCTVLCCTVRYGTVLYGTRHVLLLSAFYCTLPCCVVPASASASPIHPSHPVREPES